MSPRALGRLVPFTRLEQSAVHLAACAVALWPCATHGPPLAAHLCLTPLAIISWLATTIVSRESSQPPVSLFLNFRTRAQILRKLRMSKLRMSKEQLKSLKIRTTQMCGCVPELLWMRALNPRKNTQFSPHAGCVRHIFHGGGEKRTPTVRQRTPWF